VALEREANEKKDEAIQELQSQVEALRKSVELEREANEKKDEATQELQSQVEALRKSVELEREEKEKVIAALNHSYQIYRELYKEKQELEKLIRERRIKKKYAVSVLDSRGYGRIAVTSEMMEAAQDFCEKHPDRWGTSVHLEELVEGHYYPAKC
jgi:predicted RNase H-like nuclease (RuvC/YqgF family)